MDMTVDDYAARRGCSPRAVRKAIEAGRISATRDGRAWRINADQADREWAAHTDPARGGRHDAEAAQEPAPAGAEPDQGGIETLADSRRRWSHHRARLAGTEAELAQIKLRLERGELVDAAAEREAGFRTARAFRDRMMNIPDRIAATLAAEGDAGVIHITLTREIREACLELACLDLDTVPPASGTSNGTDNG